MESNFFIFNTYFDAFKALSLQVAKRKVDLKKKHIVVVPEKDTLKMEQMLFLKGGAFDVEVLTLKRLLAREGGEKQLSRAASSILLKQILRDAKLDCFFRSKDYKGFCGRLLTSIEMSDEYDFLGKVEGLAGSLSLKLSDIEKIKNQFENAAKQLGYDVSTPAKKLATLLQKRNFFAGASVYVAGFDKFTPSEERFFEIAREKAEELFVYSVQADGAISGEIEIYAADGNVAAIKAVSLRIKDAYLQGVKLSEMCVVLPDEVKEEARRIFAEYNLPVYIEEKTPLLECPLGAYLLILLSFRCRSEDFFLLAKNPYSGISHDDAEIFENYCVEYLIDYSRLLQPFSLFEKGKNEQKSIQLMEIAEKVRQSLAAQFFLLSDEGKTGSKAFIECIQGILEQHEEKARAKIEELLKTIAQAEQHFLFQNEDWDYLRKILIEGIMSGQLKSIPKSLDSVLAASPLGLRGNRYKRTFVIKMNDGVLPSLGSETGVLSELDLALLRAKGGDFPLQEERVKQNEQDILDIFRSSQSIFITYTSEEGSRPSSLLKDILPFVKKKFTSADEERFLLQNGDYSQAGKLLCEKSAAIEALILSAKKPTALSGTLYELFGEEAKHLFQKKEYNLRGAVWADTVSPSELQSFFSCPYKHLIDYGIRAKRRKEGKADKSDMGLAAHAVTERFAKSGFDEGLLDEIIRSVLCEGKFALESNKLITKSLELIIKEMCQTLAFYIKRGKFSGGRAEYNLGGMEQKNPLILGEAKLKGSVDYVDFFDGYVRIIDYKTGKERFSKKSLYYGKKLQLPLYMLAFRENGYKPAAMLYFVFDGGFGKKDSRLQGVFLKDEQVVSLLDKQLKFDEENESEVLPLKVKKRKEGYSLLGSGGANKSEFDAYLDYAKAVSSLAACQIKEGYFAPSPIVFEGRSSCDFCDFFSSCAFSGIQRKPEGRFGFDSEDGE
jgi:ATP-dependent helicase/nuclease subunit B